MVAGHATNVLCDNKSVVSNSSKVDSVLNKKHNSLEYHYVCWEVAAGIITMGWIAGNENLGDVCNKRLSEILIACYPSHGNDSCSHHPANIMICQLILLLV